MFKHIVANFASTLHVELFCTSQRFWVPMFKQRARCTIKVVEQMRLYLKLAAESENIGYQPYKEPQDIVLTQALLN
ncbi:hypothetical protein NIES2101_32530 [Calothrix sp. HK-06]|nr:hypothetical protein NIES2101_32530 [Calothrix sp. HK-06]